MTTPNNKFIGRIAGTVMAALMVAGCATPQADFDEVADVRQIMLSVLEPAAEVYWDSVGTIMTLEGTEELVIRGFHLARDVLRPYIV